MFLNLNAFRAMKRQIKKLQRTVQFSSQITTCTNLQNLAIK